ncbi:MAG: prepilin peptidase, partial [bacterium]
MPVDGAIALLALAAILGAACGPGGEGPQRQPVDEGPAAASGPAIPSGHREARQPARRGDPARLATCLACAVAAVCVTAGVAGRLPWATLPAWWALAVLGVAISRTDLARHRIPDALVGLLLVAGAAGLLVGALLEGGLADYGRAWMAAAACLASFLVLALVAPAGLGMGDVKLLADHGLFLGYIGWDALLLGIVLGLALAGTLGWALVTV